MTRELLRLLPLLPLLLPLLPAIGSADEVRVNVGINRENGRHAASIAGVPADRPGLADAVAKLLGCPVERSFGGFRCRERSLISGLAYSGSLDFGPVLEVLGAKSVAVTAKVPVSPFTEVAGLARRPPGWLLRLSEFAGVVSTGAPVLPYRLGFPWFGILLAAWPIPLLLLGAVFRWPEARWPWVVGMSAWCLWLGALGVPAIDTFFNLVPSVEGAFLRWLRWAPLCLLVVGQAQWIRVPGSFKMWVPLAALLLLRPRAAGWMSFSESVMVDLVAVAFLVLAITTLVKGTDGFQPLPDGLQLNLHDRLLRLSGSAGGFDVRLDQPAAGGVETHPPRLGARVSIPAVWLSRLTGEAAEAAVLLACARRHLAPMAALLVGLVVSCGVLTFFHPRVWWSLGVLPPFWLLVFLWFERRWERRVAEAVLSLGERPAVLREALAAMAPEWGPSAAGISRQIDRLTARPATINTFPRPSPE